MKPKINDIVVNSEQIIDLVKKNPILWDKYDESYKEKKEKKDLVWSEICAELIDGFNYLKKKEKEGYVYLMHKKWSHIRDNWIKAIKKRNNQRNTGEFRRLTKLYLHHKQLSFLEKLYNDEVRLERESSGIEINTTVTVKRENSISIDPDDSVEEIQVPIQRKVNVKPPAVERKRHTKVKHENSISIDDDNSVEEIEKPIQPKVKPAAVERKRHSKVMRENSISIDADDSVEEIEVPIQPKVKPAAVERKRRSKVDENPLNIKRSKYKSDIDQTAKYRYLSFFKGLMPSLLPFNDEQTLEFQAGVIRLVRKIKNNPMYLNTPQASVPSVSVVKNPLLESPININSEMSDFDDSSSAFSKLDYF